MFSGWFLTRDIPLSRCVQFHYNALLIGLSYLVAAFAAYTAFHLIECVRAAETVNARRVWLAIAGISMGFGIWAMHFIAMLAVEMPIPVGYDLQVTALSAGFAVFASWAAFGLVENKRQNLFAAGIVLGVGIDLMHYAGMAALRMAAHIYYDPWLVVLSAALVGAIPTVPSSPSVARMWKSLSWVVFVSIIATYRRPSSSVVRGQFECLQLSPASHLCPFVLRLSERNCGTAMSRPPVTNPSRAIPRDSLWPSTVHEPRLQSLHGRRQ